ncbi:prenyltransferase/squalene oxidase repeat-containing protein [Planctomicrobium sp. SH664]|uniref:prenyltransferase/squalene oxidase repeat-containing protein n=1 Tax=Planctomicrobium sp. SH664 TaxID=3448125 RepID=UPI003F5B0EED
MRALLSPLLIASLFAALAQQLLAAGPDPQQLQKSVDKGIGFLKTSQSDDGSWTSPTSVGITAIVTQSLLSAGLPPSDPAVAKALKFLESKIQPDGGIYDAESSHKNYETAVVVMALTSANADGRYQKQIDQAVNFLKKIQWDDEEAGERSNPAYGGAGYGRSQRPDLSNTAFFMEALRSAGVPASDPAMQNALLFVSRCQNLKGAGNETPFAGLVDDGGFYYTPASGGSSVAGNNPDGGLRSYGSMTYAGLKSMIYAGLTSDDRRVKAAEDWIRKFYTVEDNPGLGQTGLYYYYQTFSKALDVVGEDQFADADGKKHDWRQELAHKLISLQKENGSWVNETPRWYEGDPNLVTAYSLLALKNCKSEK